MGVATLPQTLPFPLSVGGTGDTSVGSTFSVALAGIPFLLDVEIDKPYTWGYLPTRKEQQDTSAEAGEQSLSTGYWRRSRSTWHLGAGQEYLDTEDSQPQRFDTSKGVDVWTRNKLMLLHDTEQKRSTANTNLKLMKAGAYLYMADGSSVVFTDNPVPSSPTFTSATGLTGTINDICSDGSRSYVAANGNIYRANIGSAAHSSWSTVTSVESIGIANGFFLAGAGRQLYNLDTAGVETDVTPASVFLSSGATWQWVSFVTSPIGPLVAGKGGERGLIYQGIVDETGAIAFFQLAVELPDGETIETLECYLGTTIIMGTSRGVRIGIIDDGGDIAYGPLVDTGQPCPALEPEDSFVFFSWPEFDATTSGLGRIDLSSFTIAAKPAYASDLMAGVTGSVTGIATFGTRRYFVISGQGLYGETLDKVEEGYLTTGKVRWNTLEPKHLKKVLVRTEPLDGTVELLTSTDDSAFSSYGTLSNQGDTQEEFFIEQTCQFFELKLVLSRDSADSTDGPVVTGWVALGLPIVEQQRFFEFYVMNFDHEISLLGEDIGYEGRALERLNLLHLLKDRQAPFDFQGIDYGVFQGDTHNLTSHTCTLEDITYTQSTQGGQDSFGGRIHLLLYEVR